MTRTVLMAAIGVAAILAIAPARADDAPPAPKILAMLLHNEPVSGGPDREAFMAKIEFPPGSTTGKHIHPGDEFATVIAGELQLNVEGQPPRIVKAGESYHNLQGVPHETKNISSAPAQTIATFVVEKGKPLTQPIK